MSDHDDFELVRGSGNLFRDLALPSPELEQLRSLLAARIIEALDVQRLTVRQAHELTGFAAADFSRVRHANLGRFTIDRLMTMLTRLGKDIEVTVTGRPHRCEAGLVGATVPRQHVKKNRYALGLSEFTHVYLASLITKVAGEA